MAQGVRRFVENVCMVNSVITWTEVASEDATKEEEEWNVIKVRWIYDFLNSVYTVVILNPYNSGQFRKHCIIVTPRTKFGGWWGGGGIFGITLSVCADSCTVRYFFFLWHWHTIFGTCVSPLDYVVRIFLTPVLSLFDHSGQIYMFFLAWPLVRPVTSVWFDICILYLA